MLFINYILQWMDGKLRGQSYESLEKGTVKQQSPQAAVTFHNDRCRKTVLLASIVLFALTTFVVVSIFVIVPVVFMYYIPFERLVVFTNFHQPDDPNDFNKSFIPGLRSFYVPITDTDTITDTTDIHLGVWHLLPDAIANDTIDNPDYDYDAALADSGFDIVLHFHGSGETRLDAIQTFFIVRRYFHVIAFDYRGYGDSTKAEMTEDAIVNDSKELYKWIRRKSNATNIYVWGHSLGSALSARTVSELKDEGLLPMGLILESPFTSMREEIPLHPVGKYFSWLPWFEQTILDPLEEHGFYFNNSKHILNVDCPVMILHAEDDSIVPYILGKELSQSKRKVNQGIIKYHQFPANEGLDHFWIYESPELPGYITNFTIVCDQYHNRTAQYSSSRLLENII